MDKKRKNKPEIFTLDCMALTSRMKEYEGLHDANLAAFFVSKQTRKLLHKQGLISKQGIILGQSGKVRNAPIARAREDTFPRTRAKRTNSHEAKLKPLTKHKLQEVLQKVRTQNEKKLRNTKSQETIKVTGN